MNIKSIFQQSLKIKIIIIVNISSAISIATVSIASYSSTGHTYGSNDTLRYIVTGVVMQGVVGVLAFFMARSIVKPILKMASVQKMAGMDATSSVQESQ